MRIEKKRMWTREGSCEGAFPIESADHPGLIQISGPAARSHDMLLYAGASTHVAQDAAGMPRRTRIRRKLSRGKAPAIITWAPAPWNLQIVADVG